jgi:DNA repair protein RecO (recombination protein O)
LTVCSIVLLRKSSGGLDLLTEAQVAERFGALRTNLPALYGGYYVAELLADWTEDYDPHPALFDAALAALRELGVAGAQCGLRLATFELTLLHELGYGPALDSCAACGRDPGARPGFSPSAGGVVCAACLPGQRDRRPLSPAGWRALVELRADPSAWRAERPRAVRAELRQVLGQYVTYRLGRRPKLLPYLTG